MIVGLNPNYILKQRNCAFAPAYRVNFEGTNRSNMTSAPTSDFFESSTTGQTSSEKTMTATEVLEQLRAFQKKYKHNRNIFSEYKVGGFIGTVDLDNAQRHLTNLEKLLILDSNRIDNACTKGYFSSIEGAEAFNFVIEHFNTEQKNGYVSDVDTVLTSLSPKEIFNIRNRKLIQLDKNDNFWNDKINTLAKLSDEEYARYIKSDQEELIYLSENDMVNEFLLLLAQHKDPDSSTNLERMRTFDHIIKKDLSANPDNETGIINFYIRLAEDFDYNTFNLVEVFTNSKKLNAFKKAYTYLEENGINDARTIIIEDSSKVNYYKMDDLVNAKSSKLEKDSWKVALFDIDGNFIRYNYGFNKDLHTCETVITEDSGRKYNAKLENLDKTTNIIESTKEILDAKGNLICVERYVKSEDIPNKYDIYQEFPDGKKYKIGLAEKSKNGNISIEKTLTTSKGIKTDYNYMETPDGSRFSYTKITNANGDILTENKYKYQILDDCHFKTTENDIEYYIQYNESILGNFVKVTSTDGRKVVLPIGRNSTYASSVLSKNLLPLLKRMPGSFYFDIAEYGLKKIGLDIDNVSSNGAHYDIYENLIALSNTWKDADFTLAHEIGHYRDKFKCISENPEVSKIYLEERKDFMTNEPKYEVLSTDYMINACPRATETFVDSLAELVAEVNAFLYASNMDPNIEARGQFIQEHFPETFAKIANLLLKK